MTLKELREAYSVFLTAIDDLLDRKSDMVGKINELEECIFVLSDDLEGIQQQISYSKNEAKIVSISEFLSARTLEAGSVKNLQVYQIRLAGYNQTLKKINDKLEIAAKQKAVLKAQLEHAESTPPRSNVLQFTPR